MTSFSLKPPTGRSSLSFFMCSGSIVMESHIWYRRVELHPEIFTSWACDIIPAASECVAFSSSSLSKSTFVNIWKPAWAGAAAVAGPRRGCLMLLWRHTSGWELTRSALQALPNVTGKGGILRTRPVEPSPCIYSPPGWVLKFNK